MFYRKLSVILNKSLLGKPPKFPSVRIAFLDFNLCADVHSQIYTDLFDIEIRLPRTL